MTLTQDNRCPTCGSTDLGAVGEHPLRPFCLTCGWTAPKKETPMADLDTCEVCGARSASVASHWEIGGEGFACCGPCYWSGRAELAEQADETDAAPATEVAP